MPFVIQLPPSVSFNVRQQRVPGIGFNFLRFHDLRHTHATLLLLEGVPVNAVASRLGHSGPSITLNVYGHAIKQADDCAVEASGALLRGTDVRQIK